MDRAMFLICTSSTDVSLSAKSWSKNANQERGCCRLLELLRAESDFETSKNRFVIWKDANIGKLHSSGELN